MKFGQEIKARALGDAHSEAFFEYKRVKKNIKLLSGMDGSLRKIELHALVAVIAEEVRKVNECASHMRAGLDWVDGVLPMSGDPGYGELGEFAELNRTALRKAFKKLDKALTEEERSGSTRAMRDSLSVADPTRSTGEATVGGIVRALGDPEARHRLPVHTLGKGANARVILFAEEIASIHNPVGVCPCYEAKRTSDRALSPSQEILGARRLAIKDGVWRSRERFNQEVGMRQTSGSTFATPKL